MLPKRKLTLLSKS